MKTIFSLLCLFFCLANPHAQSFEGYLINTAGDTLHGTIKFGMQGSTDFNKFKFIDQESQTKRKYKAEELSLISLALGRGKGCARRTLLSKKYRLYGTDVSKYTFLSPPIIEGELNLYEATRTNNASNYGFTSSGYMQTGLLNYDYNVYYLERGDTMIVASRLDFKNSMRYFLNGCPDLLAKLGTKGYRYKDLDEIVKEFNTCYQNQEQ